MTKRKPQNEERPKPAGVTVLAAMVLTGLSRSTTFQRLRDGSIPVLPLPGDQRPSVVGIEQIVGREISIQEIEAAERRATEIRAAMLLKKHAWEAKRKKVVAP